MQAGISTSSLYPMETETAFEVLAREGITSLEVFLNTPGEQDEPYLNELIALKKNYGTQITAVHPYLSAFEPFMVFTAYKRRFEDAKELFRRAFDYTNRLGAAILVFHGDRQGGSLPFNEYIERFGILSEIGQTHGVVLAQENVCRCRSRDIEFIADMKKALGDSAAFVLDIKQAVRSGCTPFEVLDAMGNSIRHVHVSDHNSERDCLPPGKGTFELLAFIEKLGDLDYRGSLIVELYRENFNEINELISSYEYVKAMI